LHHKFTIILIGETRGVNKLNYVFYNEIYLILGLDFMETLSLKKVRSPFWSKIYFKK